MRQEESLFMITWDINSRFLGKVEGVCEGNSKKSDKDLNFVRFSEDFWDLFQDFWDFWDFYQDFFHGFSKIFRILGILFEIFEFISDLKNVTKILSSYLPLRCVQVPGMNP